jgi:hypothetical protein
LEIYLGRIADATRDVVRRTRTVVVRAAVAALVVALAAPSPALAESPGDALSNAVRATATARSAKVSIAQHTTTSGRTSDMYASGVLAGGDLDLTMSGDAGTARNVAVGPRVKERRPDKSGQAWKEHSRNQPTQTTALGPLSLADGTSLGDTKLYKSVVEGGTETLPQGPARKLIGELNMAALAVAMKRTGADATRMAQWTGTMTVWVGADGRVTRNTVHLTIPSATSPITIDAQVDLSELDAPITITLP